MNNSEPKAATTDAVDAPASGQTKPQWKINAEAAAERAARTPQQRAEARAKHELAMYNEELQRKDEEERERQKRIDEDLEEFNRKRECLP
jgi:hypothetical protein